jgi:hypothetical protein
VGVVAFARAPAPFDLILCAALAAFAYLTGRTNPPVQIPVSELWRAVGLGSLVLTVAAAAAIAAPAGQLAWVQVAMASCSANRFRAGALFGAG